MLYVLDLNLLGMFIMNYEGHTKKIDITHDVGCCKLC